MTAVVVLIVVVMPVHAFVSTWLGTAIGPLLVWKSWKEILLAGLIPVVVWYGVLRPDIIRILRGRWVNKLIALYALLHIGLAFVSTASAQAVIAGLLMNLRFLAIFVIVQIIAEANPDYLAWLKERIPRFMLWAMVGLGILAALQVFVLPRDFLVQFGYNKDTTIAPYIVVDQDPNALRAFATMRGPNALGAYLLLPLAIAVFTLYKKRRDVLAWAALILGLLALGLSGSRSAWLGAGAMLVTLGVLMLPRLHFRRWMKMGIVVLVVLVGVVGWATEQIPSVHLAVFHTAVNDSSANVGSNVKHWQATAHGIADVVRHPFGAGPGSAGPASFYNANGANLSEDYYVQIAQEVGIIGLGLFVAINWLTVLAIVRRRRELLPIALLASVAGVSLINLFLHGWADDPTSLTWWAFAGLYVGKD